MASDQWLTVREVAERLRVHPDSVRRWLRAGRMQGYLISRRGGYRIRSAEIDRFLVGGDDLLPVAPARLIAEAETSQFDQDEP